MPTLITRRKTFDPNDVFMQTQKRIILDDSKGFFFEKTRRGGGTWAIGYRSVRRGALKKNPRVNKSWFSSSDDSNTLEYMDYCDFWARQVQVKAELIGECLYDKETDITSRCMRLANGFEIHGLTSNYRQFRGKGGDGYLDEFAHHDNQPQMWKAFTPISDWGGSLVVLSSHNGPNSLFNRMISEIRTGKRKGWGLYTLTIQQAIKEGIVDRKYGRKATEKEVKAFLQECRDKCFDEESFLQEYCCVPIDESTAFLPYDLIGTCEKTGILLQHLGAVKNPLYLGVDIGRHKHLTVFWLLEDTGPMLVQRQLIVKEKTPFREQQDELYKLLRMPNLRRCCIDATGMGEQMAEDAVRDFGTYKVEAVKFTAPVKESLAHGFKRQFDDGNILIEKDDVQREDLHSVRRVVSAAGTTRFDVSSPERLGHADRFWAAALAVNAARGLDNSPPAAASASGRGGGFSERRLNVGYSDFTTRWGIREF